MQMQSALKAALPRIHHTDDFQSHERQEIVARDLQVSQKHEGSSQEHEKATNSSEPEAAEDEAVLISSPRSPRSPREEFGRTSDRERQKSRSLHNGVNEDEQISITPTRAKVSVQVLAARTSLSSFSTSQALIRKHFRDSSYSDLYNPDDDKRKLNYINECSREEETDSSDDEGAIFGENDETPEYQYDDFIRDFSSIVEAEVESDQSSTEQRDDKIGESSPIDEKGEPPSLNIGLFSTTQYEMNSVSLDRHHNSFIDNSSTPSKSPNSRPLQAQANHSHPHNVPSATMELSKAQLEEKLRGISGTSKDCGSSVATSDLGSIMTRVRFYALKCLALNIFSYILELNPYFVLFTKDSEISRSFNRPKMIFHRTNPPVRTPPDSVRSSPSSKLQNVNEASQARMKVLSSENHPSINQPEQVIDPNDDVNRSQELLRSRQAIDPNDDVNRSQELRRAQEARNINAGVIASQRLLRNNVSSAATSAKINEQLSKLRSKRKNQAQNRDDGAKIPSVLADPTSNWSFGSKQVSGIDKKSKLPVKNEPQPVTNRVGTLRWKYEQSISNASSGSVSAATNRVNKPPPSLARPKPTPSTEISPKLTTRQFQNRSSVSDIPNQHDDASQYSCDVFEIAPRGGGYGVLNKNQWINYETSNAGEDRSVGVHDVHESASQHAFEVTLLVPGNAVVAQLPSRSKLNRPQNAPYILSKSPLRTYNTAPHYSSLSSTTSTDDSVHRCKPQEHKTYGSRVASSPFLKKASATIPKGSIPNSTQGQNPIKASNARNLFSNGWKHSPDKKPPTVLNRSVGTDKLKSRFKSSKKSDSSWIAKQDLKGKKDNSWIAR